MTTDWLFYLEWLGVATGALCVWLNSRQNIWGWPVGLVNMVCYTVICWNGQLYAETGLQIFYGITSVYGWYSWAKNKKHNTQHSIEIQKLNPKKWLWVILTGCIFWGVIWWILHRFTNGDVPAWDALTTAFSLVGQYLLAKRYLENWLLWIGVNAVSIGIYYYKDLHLTAALFLVYLFLAIHGYRKWKNDFDAKKV